VRQVRSARLARGGGHRRRRRAAGGFFGLCGAVPPLRRAVFAD